MNIELSGEQVIVTGVDESYYIVTPGTGTEKAAITVKDRPYRLKAVKLDSETGEPLAGVGFKLYRQITVDNVEAWDPNPYPGYGNLISGEDGVIFDVDTLPAGTYQLRETSPISGYQTISGHITFTISRTGSVSLTGTNPPDGYIPIDAAIHVTVRIDTVTASKGVTQYAVYRKGDPHWVEGQDEDTLQIQVTNSSGETLPLTGGSGTGMIYFTGVMLIVLAAAGLLHRRV